MIPLIKISTSEEWKEILFQFGAHIEFEVLTELTDRQDQRQLEIPFRSPNQSWEIQIKESTVEAVGMMKIPRKQIKQGPKWNFKIQIFKKKEKDLWITFNQVNQLEEFLHMDSTSSHHCGFLSNSVKIQKGYTPMASIQSKFLRKILWFQIFSPTVPIKDGSILEFCVQITISTTSLGP